MQDGWTAFPAACQKGHNKVVSNFLEAGVDLNIQTEVSDITELYYACLASVIVSPACPACVSLFLEEYIKQFCLKQAQISTNVFACM